MRRLVVSEINTGIMLINLNRDFPVDVILPMFLASRMSGFMAHWREAMSKSPPPKCLQSDFNPSLSQLNVSSCGGLTKFTLAREWGDSQAYHQVPNCDSELLLESGHSFSHSFVRSIVRKVRDSDSCNCRFIGNDNQSDLLILLCAKHLAGVPAR